MLSKLLGISLAAIIWTGCVDDSYLSLPPVVPNQSFVEEFDTVQNAYNKGWRFVNRSIPIGPANWEQATNFNSYSSSSTYLAHIEQSYDACAGTTPEGKGVLSNWIISPSLTLQNGDKIIFYTRDFNTSFIDRLQVRINSNNESIECGRGTEVGNFDKLLLDINPRYSDDPTIGGFPESWTRFEATVAGLEGARRGRFAFRAFIEGAGPGNSERGSIIGIDSVAYVGKK